jgi:hypothetical protein
VGTDEYLLQKSRKQKFQAVKDDAYELREGSPGKPKSVDDIPGRT